MANDFFTATGNPAAKSQGSSAVMRAEFAAIEDGFDKFPTLTGNGGKVVVVNSGGTALEAVSGTGTGSIVRATSPTLVTPDLGTPSAVVLTNATGLPATSILSGTASININGTVGAVTPTTGAFTTVSASGQITGADGTAGAPSYSFASSGNTDNGMYLSAANEVSFSTAGTKRVTVTSDGRLYGTAIHNNAGAVTGTTNQYIASGTYTPTVTNISNTASRTSNEAKWMRVGNVVTVSGMTNITPSSAALLGVTITLPIASTFSERTQCSGVSARGGGGNVTPDTGTIYGVSDYCVLAYVASDTDASEVYWTFTYVVR